MNIQVRYHSRSGKTKAVAESIAEAANVTAEGCDTTITEPVDLLFIGGGIYWGGPDKKLKKFIAELDPAQVKNIAVFATAALSKAPAAEIAELLTARGITPINEGFGCKGAMLVMHIGHPDTADKESAAAFAKATIASIE